jgi:cytochrome P450
MTTDRKAGMTESVLEPFNPFDPAFHEDPYRVYRTYRESDPVHLRPASEISPMGGVYLFRYADVAAALKDNRVGRERQKLIPPDEMPRLPDEYMPFVNMATNWMLFRDPPDHTRLRMLVNRAFTPRTIEKRKDEIAAIADALIDDVADHGEMDLIADFAFLLPVTVIAQMLGVHYNDRRMFRDWSAALASAIDARASNEGFAAASEATLALTEYLQAIFAARRTDPQDDLISMLLDIQRTEGQERLSDDEMVATCILLLVAGHETTTNLIGNGTLALLHNRDQWDTLLANPGNVVTAVEEMLRYDAPVQMTFRYALEDVEIDGVAVERGQQVGMVLGSANRDPDQYPDPDVLDVTREPRVPGSFGFGIHFCLGAGLARAEGQIALETLLRRTPDLQLQSADQEWRPTVAFRGLERLPVTF